MNVVLSKIKTVNLGLCALSLIAVAIAFYVYRDYKYQSAFETLQPGSSEKNVQNSFGTPSQIDCSKWARQRVYWIDHPVDGTPVQLYLYMTDSKMWVIGFDRNLKVISKETRNLP